MAHDRNERVTVWRVESRHDRLGPWQTDQYEMSEAEQIALSSFQRLSYDHFGNFPTPTVEGIISSHYNYERGLVCAVQSLAKLLEWFGDWLQYLKDAGFIVRCYEVERRFVSWGRQQCMFWHDRARVVEEIPI